MYLQLIKRSLAVTILTSTAATAATATLVNEDFTAGTAAGTTWTSEATGVSSGQQWTFTGLDGTTATMTEMWTGTGGASARGLATTYDHDQNAATANIDIPGGFEVMSGFTSDGLPDSIRVGVQVVLPNTLDASASGLLTFLTENRIAGSLGGNTPLYSIFNLTDNREITPLTAPDQPTAAWNFQSVNVALLGSDAGDTIELRFQESITEGASGGARGLQVADVNFSVSTIPEPSSTALLGLGGLALILRRRK